MDLKLSLVVPCYNEAENVLLFQEETIKAFAGCGYSYEIVFVDDGSQDATLHQLKKMYAANKCPVKVVSFSRNFGKESALCRLSRPAERRKGAVLLQKELL